MTCIVWQLSHNISHLCNEQFEYNGVILLVSRTLVLLNISSWERGRIVAYPSSCFFLGCCGALMLFAFWLGKFIPCTTVERPYLASLLVLLFIDFNRDVTRRLVGRCSRQCVICESMWELRERSMGSKSSMAAGFTDMTGRVLSSRPCIGSRQWSWINGRSMK